LSPLFASTLGQVFQPLFQAMAWMIAFFYALIPNYAIAIALLTVVVMIVTAPLTVKSTKSMVQMQRLAPELKKLQAKYKGDKQTLNEEMMKLYREHGVNPAGGCLPLVIQFPVFIILYDVIRGLTTIVNVGHYYRLYPHGMWVKCLPGPPCSSPRYIPYTTRLYGSLQANHGKMPSFGIDLASKLLGHHSFVLAIPYAVLILIAIALQYLQMRQLNSRNPQMAQANPQAQMMQRYMPILFAIIYINIAAAVNVYFIVSSICRIGIQEMVFRSGVLSKPAKVAEETLPGRPGAAPKKRTFMERLADAQKRALEQQEQQRARRELEAGSSDSRGGAGSPPDGGAKGPQASVPPKRKPTEGPAGNGGGPSPNGGPRAPQPGSKAKRGKKGN
jgi:YidC/Oxa1 family membrane protein insertase